MSGRRPIRAYENGVLDIPSIALIALARYYQVSTDYLLGLTDERKPYPPARKMTETPPQSGSGRKEQPKSKAAPRNCTHSFAQRVQSAYCQAFYGRGGGRGPHGPDRHIKSGCAAQAFAPRCSRERGVFSAVENGPFVTKRDALQRLFSFVLFTRSSRGRKER